MTQLLNYFNNDILPYARRIERNLQAMEPRITHTTVKDESQPEHKAAYRRYQYGAHGLTELGVQFEPSRGEDSEG